MPSWSLQLPATIGFRFERTRLPSRIRNPASEYPNNQRAFQMSSDCSLVIGAFLPPKEESVLLIHRTRTINGASLNSPAQILKSQRRQFDQFQQSNLSNSLRHQKLSCCYHRDSSPNLSVSFQFVLKWYQHLSIKRRPSTFDCLPHSSL